MLVTLLDLPDSPMLSCRFALAFTLYFTIMHVMAYWCYDMATFRSFWFATINSNNMWYAFLKAWVNVLVGKITRKQSGFKVTLAALCVAFLVLGLLLLDCCCLVLAMQPVHQPGCESCGFTHQQQLQRQVQCLYCAVQYTTAEALPQPILWVEVEPRVSIMGTVTQHQLGANCSLQLPQSCLCV